VDPEPVVHRSLLMLCGMPAPSVVWKFCCWKGVVV
jgi:hypothetical protein